MCSPIGRLVVVLLALQLGVEKALGQAFSELPRPQYYAARELHSAGAQLTALEGFGVAYGLARRVGNVRWVDSIPPLVMSGECLYQQGQISEALSQYDAALALLVQNPAWIDQLDLVVDEVEDFELNKGLNWFNKRVPGRILRVPEAIQLAADPLAAQATPGGAVVAPVSLVTRLDAAEVFYTIAIALSRRAELLGPLTPHNPLTAPLIEVFDSRRGHPIPWVAQSWTLLSGLARLGADPNSAAGVNALRESVQVGGSYHYLSSVALEALAGRDAKQGKYQQAIENLQTAHLLAAQFQQHVTLNSTTKLLYQCGAAGGQAALADALEAFATWSRKSSPMARATAMAGAARILAGTPAQERARKAAAAASSALIA
ncbi:MAG TPA: hypothetical protein DDW52_08730, partial [Planctomycetaceae bacterium]|nr:hypothetical protein [Planctomycetaceae bacterium]